MAMFENFPYTDMHNLNLDWIIKIAKDFLDQYTHIQELIANGEQSLQDLTASGVQQIGDLTTSGLQELSDKADELETLLQGWYDTHSADIANQLADALADLNDWYTTHQNYLDTTLTANIALFNQRAEQKASETIQTIPSDYSSFYQEFQAVQKDLRSHNIIQPKSAWGYFYGYGYFNSNLAWTDSDTLITLKVPLPNPSFVILKCPTNFQPSSISGSLLYTWELNDGTLSRSYISGDTRIVASMTDNLYEAGCSSWGNVEYAYILVVASMMDNIDVVTFDPLRANLYSADIPKGIIDITPQNTSYGTIFRNETQYSQLSGGAIAYWIEVKAGDVFSNLSRVTGISYVGSFRSADGQTKVKINSIPTYTVPADGIVNLFDMYTNPLGFRYTPINRTKLLKSDILDLDSGSEQEYNGLNAVAFGTSLTYRAISTSGYLNYLPQLSGMSFDNQGVGGGVIHAHGDQPWILDKIRNYTGYANKRVCLLEGFCNDFGYNYDLLGQYTDSTDATVCGSVRIALNYLLSRNPDMTVFLVLDHYGRNYGGVDSSSTAKNSNNQTQYQWYEEISKVAESLGIPVIKLYSISGISENTPQYLADNIHPTALGAEQTAKVMWSIIKQHFPNVVSQ